MNVNKEMSDLKNLLYSKEDSGKTTIYYAIAYAIVYRTTLLVECKNLSMAVKMLTDEICELAILDRVRVEKTIKDLYLLANIDKSLREGILNTTYPSTFEGALFIDRFISKNIIDDVNNNMSLFNSIVIGISNLKNHIFDND